MNVIARPSWTIWHGFVVRRDFEVEWKKGSTITQKRRNIRELHTAIGQPTLEVSTKSESILGQNLSSANIKLDGRYLENIFQASKVYSKGGPYFDIFELSPEEARKDPRHKTSGVLQYFYYKSKYWSIEPKSMFYDYLYILAVKQSIDEEKIKEILEYEFFTDIEFNPVRCINCQARPVAIIKLCYQLFGEIPTFEGDASWGKFYKLFVKS